MLTQRFQRRVGMGKVVANSFVEYFPSAVSQHFPSQDEVLCIDRGFLVQLRS